MPKVVMVTGMHAAGKTSVGPLLAQRLTPPATALDGDVCNRNMNRILWPPGSTASMVGPSYREDAPHRTGMRTL